MMAYQPVCRSPSSKIPTLRKSQLYRRHSSRLDLLKLNYRRRIVLQKEEEKRILSAPGQEGNHGSYLEEKRPSLPIMPRPEKQQKRGQRRHTIGKYGEGPKILTPLKNAEHVPPQERSQREHSANTPNRRYSKPSITDRPDIEKLTSALKDITPNKVKSPEHRTNGQRDPQPPVMQPVRKKPTPRAKNRKMIEWNFCTEVENRTPTPIFDSEKQDTAPNSAGKKRNESISSPDKKLNNNPVIPPIANTNSNQPANPPIINPKPKVKDPFKAKTLNPNLKQMEEKERIKQMIKKKEEELKKKIEEEERRLQQLEEEQERYRKEEQLKRIEEQKRKRIAEEKKRRLSQLQTQQLHDPVTEKDSGVRSVTSKGNVHKPVESDEPEPQKDHHAAIYELAAPDEHGDVSLVPCEMCGRKFNADRLDKHTKVCKKVSNTKRKVFDTTKKRSEGTDNAAYIRRGVHLQEQPKAKRKDWKTAHEEFQSIVKAARTGDSAPPTVNPDYVPCPHCNRTFNETAAERHIPKCREAKMRRPPVKVTKKR